MQMQIKLILTRKIGHLASFWKWRFLELASDASDGNEDGNKEVALDWQNNNFAVCITFLVHFFAVAAQLQCESA